MEGPTWQSPLLSARAGHILKAALFTTYRPPDAGLLVEHVLPSILGLDRAFTSDAEARPLYFGELARELEKLRGKLTVITSCAVEEGDSTTENPSTGTYPWLWRYVTPFSVGANRAAIQHAKLWMLHWYSESGDDILEMVISSTNLTSSAFKAQLQSGWRSEFVLHPRGTKINQSSWGPLTGFLKALGTSAGQYAQERTDYFVTLLARALCPQGLRFLASVPNAARQEKQWGAKALGKIAPAGRGRLTISACVPFIGDWSDRLLSAWCNDIGVEPGDVKLNWIDQHHPWASGNGKGEWRMPASALAAFTNAGVNIVRLGHPIDRPLNRFHLEHSRYDERWSHAKFYMLKRGKAKRLLITSANFSASAWGAGKRPSRNFELGVLLESDWPISGETFDFNCTYKPHTSVLDEQVTSSSIFTWSAATWDGEKIWTSCRTVAAVERITIAVAFTKPVRAKPLAVKCVGETATGSVKWRDSKNPPLLVRITAGAASCVVPIIDLRDPIEFAKTPLPEVDPEASESIGEALLLESYGDPYVAEGDLDRRAEAEGNKHPLHGASDYSLEIFIQARAWFAVVKTWQQRWDYAKDSTDFDRALLKSDGARLLAFFNRKRTDSNMTIRLPAKLVHEELGRRLKESTNGR